MSSNRTTKCRLRLRIAEWLNKRHSEYCWPMLVLWALGHEKFWDLFKGRLDLSQEENCDWCGKCGSIRNES